MALVLDEILERFRSLPADQQAELRTLAAKDIEDRAWVPTPGPQMDAYFSKADVLLFGGQAGGGKSDLGLGLGLTAHQSSLILRRQYTDLSGLTDRAIQLNGSRKGYNGSIPPKLRRSDGRLIEFGACARPGDEQSWQGRPHDLIVFDEGCQFTEAQVRFLITWNRSTNPNQRCRIVIPSNPPLGPEGEWLIRFFAPWLDPMHSNPAKPGELRWFVTDDDGRDYEADGPEEVRIGGRWLRPLSRTFIPSKLSDNPFLARTDYAAKLDSLPEPYRSAFRDGNFMAARRDQPNQLIPSKWLLEAQARWTPTPPPGVPMCAMGVDCSGGGEDPMTIAPRYDAWFDRIVEIPGSELPIDRMGTFCAGQIVSYRRDNAVVVVDMGGGYGGPVYEHLKANEIETIPYKGAEESLHRTADKQLGFTNKRTAALWRLREALDPGQPGGSPIALPPDPMLMADLSAPGFEVTSRGIKAETKESVCARLGRSTNRGDAVIMCWTSGATSLTHGEMWRKGQKSGSRQRRPNVVQGHERERAFLRRA